jgi:hypothetical protein
VLEEGEEESEAHGIGTLVLHLEMGKEAGYSFQVESLERVSQWFAVLESVHVGGT